MLHIPKIHGRFALNSLTHDSYSVTCVGTRKKNHVLLFFRMCQYKLIKSFLHWTSSDTKEAEGLGRNEFRKKMEIWYTERDGLCHDKSI
jgi:hypothetical protein